MTANTQPDPAAHTAVPLGEALEAGLHLYLRSIRPTLTATLVFAIVGMLFATFIAQAFLLPLYDGVSMRFVHGQTPLFPSSAAAYVYGSAGTLVLFLLALAWFESLNLTRIARIARGRAAHPVRPRAQLFERGLAFFVWMLLYMLALALATLPLAGVVLYGPRNLLWALLLVSVAYLPSLYVMITFSFGPNSVIQDRLNPLYAFVQNFRLVMPHWWRTLSYMLIAYTAVHTVIAVFIVLVWIAVLLAGTGSFGDLRLLLRSVLIALGYGTVLGGIISVPLFNAMLVAYYERLKASAADHQADQSPAGVTPRKSAQVRK